MSAGDAITVELKIVDQSQADKIWDALKTGDQIMGCKITTISWGNKIRELNSLLEELDDDASRD